MSRGQGKPQNGQGNVREKSGNFVRAHGWTPCIIMIIIIGALLPQNIQDHVTKLKSILSHGLEYFGTVKPWIYTDRWIEIFFFIEPLYGHRVLDDFFI